MFPDKSGNSIEVRDFWSSSESTQPIIIREALALKNTLVAGVKSLSASQVDVRVDSLPLVRTWANQGGKSKALSDVIQVIYETTLQLISPCPWRMFLQRITSQMPPLEHSLAVTVCYLSAFGKKLRSAGAVTPSI